MELGGLVPFTTIDYPGGFLAAVLFCQGCPWRCVYCHNPHLQPRNQTTYSWQTVLEFLQERKNWLDAVVFSGGEPLLQEDLGCRMEEVKALGFKIGLHTAGIFPIRLQRVLPFCDWIGMDIKGPWLRYQQITNVEPKDIQSAVTYVVACGKPYEMRTSIHPKILSLEEIQFLATDLAQRGVSHFALQRIKSVKFNNFYPEEALAALCTQLQSLFPHFTTRF